MAGVTILNFRKIFFEKLKHYEKERALEVGDKILDLTQLYDDITDRLDEYKR